MAQLRPLTAPEPADDGWQHIFDQHGHPLGQVNRATGSYRVPQRDLDLSPEMAAAERLLPELLLATIVTPDGKRITPWQWLTLQGLSQAATTLIATREVARDTAEQRNQGRLVAPVTRGIDNWQTDRQTTKAFQQIRDNALSGIVLMEQAHRELLSAIQRAIAEGTRFEYERTQLDREDERFRRAEARRQSAHIFNQQHSPEAYAHKRRIETIETEGRVQVEITKAQSEATLANEARQQAYVLQQSVLSQLPAITQTIAELQLIYSTDYNTGVMQMINALREIADAANNLTNTDETVRARAEAKLLQQNVPMLVSEARSLNEQQRALALQQSRKKPDLKPRPAKPEGQA